MLESDGVLICGEKYLEPLSALSVCFSDASQTLRSECDVTPERLKQTLSTRIHKHLCSGSNGERMCRCVRLRNRVRKGGDGQSFRSDFVLSREVGYGEPQERV